MWLLGERGTVNRYSYAVLTLIGLVSIALGLSFSDQATAPYLVSQGAEAANLAFIMLWETWWALVLGFSIAGGVEAWLSRESIASALEGSGPRELGIAAFFGFVSSSCSFSAIATAKNLFKKGASASASLGSFMFASTNLVIEIGLVMWVLLGWQFVVADFIGGFVLIVLMAIAFTLFIPQRIIDGARTHAIEKEGLVETDPVCGMDVDTTEAEHTVEYEGKTYYFCGSGCASAFDPEEMGERGLVENLTTYRGWRALADKQWKEWGMLWEDIAIGFVLAGIIGAFIPQEVWLSLFSGEAVLGLPVFVLWTAVLGAVIGIATFVCSVGNVPFAAILWNNGLPFGSVLSYIYADLIIPPIMDAYGKYYGGVFAAILSLTIFVAAVVAGFVIHFLFLGAGAIPPAGGALVVEKGIELNYKAWLNGFFTLVFLGLYSLHRRGAKDESSHGH